MSDLTTVESFNQAFIAAQPDIASEILDFTHTQPRWTADLWDLKRWEATDTVMQQLIFRGSMPEVERGFDRWKRLAASSGCEPCTNDCSYNFTQFSGHGLERRLISLMRREFMTPEYCVNEIRSGYEYEQMFGKILENIESQVAFFKEINIGQNFLTGIAKKILVDGAGIKGNSADPYVYRAAGSATLSKLNTRLTTRIYENLRRRTGDVVPYDVQNGQPIYAISCSDEIMDNLYLSDANARADLRFSSASDALLTRYNFMSSVRGQFINAPILYPRRFNIVDGEWAEVFPYVNGIPAELGTFSDLNPAWESADYEEVLFYGKNPFAVYYRDPISTVGQGTEFGPEPSFMNQWIWVNPQTTTDPFRRVGYYATSIEIALSPQYSGGIYGLMVPRASGSLIVEYYPTAPCPPDASECSNEVPDIITCPCPIVLSAAADPFTAGQYNITFGVPVQAEVDDTIQLGIATGGYLTGTVEAVSDDNLTLAISFSASTVITNCNGFTFVFCDDTLGCRSQVLQVNDCRSGITGQFDAVLANPIKAVTAADIVYGYMGDGSVQHFDVVSVDMLTNTWTLKYSSGYGPTDNPDGTGDPVTLEGDLNCNRNGIVYICVPPSTDATCPECGTGPVVTPCAS